MCFVLWFCDFNEIIYTWLSYSKACSWTNTRPTVSPTFLPPKNLNPIFFPIRRLHPKSPLETFLTRAQPTHLPSLASSQPDSTLFPPRPFNQQEIPSFLSLYVGNWRWKPLDAWCGDPSNCLHLLVGCLLIRKTSNCTFDQGVARHLTSSYLLYINPLHPFQFFPPSSLTCIWDPCSDRASPV